MEAMKWACCGVAPTLELAEFADFMRRIRAARYGRSLALIERGGTVKDGTRAGLVGPLIDWGADARKKPLFHRPSRDLSG